MKAPGFWKPERVNRMLVSGLMCLGVLWPMLMAFGIDSARFPPRALGNQQP